MERELDTIADLVEYLQTLPQTATPFFIVGHGIFSSVTTEDITVADDGDVYFKSIDLSL